MSVRFKAIRNFRKVLLLKRTEWSSRSVYVGSSRRNHFCLEMNVLENRIYNITGFYKCINENGYSAGVVLMKFAMLFLVPAYVCTHVYTLFKVDFDEKVFKAGIIANLINIAIKTNYIYLRRDELDKLRVKMWRFQTNRLKRLESLQILRNEYENVRRITLMYIGTMVTNALVWEIIPLIFSRALSKGITQGSEREIFDRLPSAFGPINTTSTSHRASVFFFELFAGLAGSFFFVSTDLIIISLSFMIRDQFKVLNRHLLSTINKTSLSDAKTDRYWSEVWRNKNLKIFIKDHQQLLWICKRLRDFLSPLMGFQLLASVITIGFSIYGFRDTPPPVNGSTFDYMIHYLQYFLYFISSFLQLILFCGLSEELKLAAGRVRRTILWSDWINRPVEFKKQLIIILIRTQKNYNLTALQMMEIHFKIFSQLLRLSYSYYSALRQMESK